MGRVFYEVCGSSVRRAVSQRESDIPVERTARESGAGQLELLRSPMRVPILLVMSRAGTSMLQPCSEEQTPRGSKFGCDQRPRCVGPLTNPSFQAPSMSSSWGAARNEPRRRSRRPARYPPDPYEPEGTPT